MPKHRTEPVLLSSPPLAGHALVETGNLVEGYRSVASGDETGHTAQLGDLRMRLQGLPSSQGDVLNVYLRDNFGDLPQGVETSGLSTWLATQCSDQDLLHFLDRHTQGIESQRQSEGVRNAISDTKLWLLDKQSHAVQDGWLSSNAIVTAGKALDASVFIGDIWDTMLYGYGGYHYPGTNHVVIAPSLFGGRQSRKEELIQRIQEVLPHELNHLQFTGWMPSWLDESLTEHINLAYRYGSPDVIDPILRAEDATKGTYRIQRRLVSTVMNRGLLSVPAGLATRAYTSGSANSIESIIFNEMVNISWAGRNVIGEVTEQIGRVEANIRRSNPDYPALRVQHEAAVVVLGQMIERGQRLQVVHGTGNLALV